MKMMMMMITRQLEAAGLPKSSALGLFGIPGLTAYLGLMEIGKPKVGLLLLLLLLLLWRLANLRWDWGMISLSLISLSFSR